MHLPAPGVTFKLSAHLAPILTAVVRITQTFETCLITIACRPVLAVGDADIRGGLLVNATLQCMAVSTATSQYF